MSKNIQENHLLDGKVKVFVQQSLSSYESVHSFIRYLHKVTRTPWPVGCQHQLSTFIAKKRTILKQKQKLGLEIKEGKKSMSREAYLMIAKFLFCSSQPEHIFAHDFLS